MADFEWMENSSFREEINSRVSSSAGNQGMERYQTAITEALMEHLTEKREVRLLEESRKIESEQRTKQDALKSVNVLMEEACLYARADKRTTVTKQDFERAYEAKFCMVWPFC